MNHPKFYYRIRETILNCIYAHKKHWQCYNYQPTYSIDVPENKDIEIHKVEVKWEGDETRPDSFATRNCYPIQDNDTKRMIAEKLDYLKSGIICDACLWWWVRFLIKKKNYFQFLILAIIFLSKIIFQFQCLVSKRIQPNKFSFIILI